MQLANKIDFRSQTLDSAELDSKKYVEESRNTPTDQRPPSVASVGRSFSSNSPNPSLDRRLTGSQESVNMSRLCYTYY